VKVGRFEAELDFPTEGAVLLIKVFTIPQLHPRQLVINSVAINGTVAPPKLLDAGADVQNMKCHVVVCEDTAQPVYDESRENVVSTIPASTPFQIKDTAPGNWFRVVPGSFIVAGADAENASDAETVEQGVRWVKLDTFCSSSLETKHMWRVEKSSLFKGVNIRAEPSLQSTIVGSLEPAEKVEICGFQGEWLKLAPGQGKIPPGTTGWARHMVSAENLSICKPEGRAVHQGELIPDTLRVPNCVAVEFSDTGRYLTEAELDAAVVLEEMDTINLSAPVSPAASDSQVSSTLT
jgi:hypothetical protein